MIGILLVYPVNLALGPNEARRWTVAPAAVPECLLLIGAYFQPESPSWLVKKGREAETRNVLGAGWIVIACWVLLKAIFSLSWGGNIWIMLGEIYPLRVRDAAMSIATFGNDRKLPRRQDLPGPGVVGRGRCVFFSFAAISLFAFLFAPS